MSIDRHKSRWHQPPTDSTRVKLIKEQYKESHLIIIKDEIVKDKKESSGSITTPTIVTNAPSKPNQPQRPLQATLIDFVGKKENSGSQVDSVIDAIKELTLEVKDMKKHKNICNIAFQDVKKSTMLEALRKCNNIIEFAKVTTDFEWFYNEKSEIVIVRCKACFLLFL